MPRSGATSAICVKSNSTKRAANASNKPLARCSCANTTNSAIAATGYPARCRPRAKTPSRQAGELADELRAALPAKIRDDSTPNNTALRPMKTPGLVNTANCTPPLSMRSRFCNA